jgi:hypothetical protein
MPWLYQNTEFTDPQDYFGMVYLITNIQTGKQYIGRKLFTKAKTKPKSKTNKRKKKLRVVSNWESYYGSSAELLEDIASLGQEQFKREVLHLCKKRGECNYYEALEILTRGALLSDKFYNKWVSHKLHKSSLAHLS